MNFRLLKSIFLIMTVSGCNLTYAQNSDNDYKIESIDSVIDESNLRGYIKVGGGNLNGTRSLSQSETQAYADFVAKNSGLDPLYKTYPIKTNSVTLGWQRTIADDQGTLATSSIEISTRSLGPFPITNWHPNGTRSSGQKPIDNQVEASLFTLGYALNMVYPSSFYIGWVYGLGYGDFETKNIGRGSGAGFHIAANVGYQFNRRFGIELLYGVYRPFNLSIKTGDVVLGDINTNIGPPMIISEIALVARF